MAFDLFRHELRSALFITKPDSLKHERELWGKASIFYAEADKFPAEGDKEVGPKIWAKLSREDEFESILKDLWNYDLLDQPLNEGNEADNETKNN